MRLSDLIQKSNSDGILMSDAAPFSESCKTEAYNQLERKSTIVIFASIVAPIGIFIVLGEIANYGFALIAGIISLVVGIVIAVKYGTSIITEQNKIIREKLESFYTLRYQMAHNITACEIVSFLSTTYANNFTDVGEQSDDIVSFHHGGHSYELTTDTVSYTFTLRTPQKSFESGEILNYSTFYTEMMSELPKLAFTIQDHIKNTEKTTHTRKEEIQK